MGCCGAANRIHVKNENTLNGRYVSSAINQFEGPVKERKCQDVMFLIIFIAVLTLVIFEYIKISEKDIDRFLNGIDDNGNICGTKNDKFENISASGQDMTDKTYFVSCDRYDYVCNEPARCDYKCPEDYSRIIFGWCRPNSEFIAGTRILKHTGSFIWYSIEDIIACKSDIIFLCIIAFFLNIIIILFLRYFAGIIIWVILTTVGIGLLLLTLLLWLIWRDKCILSEEAIGTEQERLYSLSYVYYISAIISSAILVIYILIVLSMRKRVQLVAMLFEEAGEVVKAMPMLLILPLWTFIIVAFVVLIWIDGWISFYILSEPYVIQRKVIYPSSVKFYKAMMLYFSLASYWLLQFIIGCQDVVIAGSVAEWYFSRDKTRLTTPILKSLSHLVSYHLGSVAFGSAAITVVKLWRIILIRLEKMSRNKSNQLKWKCCKCCFMILRNFLIYLNKNAFIEIAIYGHGFCKSAQKAFYILTNNALRVIAINSIGSFVLLISKSAVLIITCLVGLELLKNKDDLNFTAIPILTACFLAYIISTCFMSVYDMVIDSLFICFCEDCEMNDGVNRPYFMSKSLMIFVERSKSAMDFPQLSQKF